MDTLLKAHAAANLAALIGHNMKRLDLTDSASDTEFLNRTTAYVQVGHRGRQFTVIVTEVPEEPADTPRAE